MKKVGTILALAGPAYISNLAEHQRQGAIEVLNSIHATAIKFNDGLGAVAADQNLTAQGRAARAVTLAQAALAQLEVVETTTVRKLVQRADSIEQSLQAKATHRPSTVPAERLAHEQRLREIRDQLRGLDASERVSVYRASSDPLVLAAFETAPMTLSENGRRFESFIDPAVIADVVMARAEEADPTSANTLREVRSLAEVYRLAVNGVRREIHDAVPGSAATALQTAV